MIRKPLTFLLTWCLLATALIAAAQTAPSRISPIPSSSSPPPALIAPPLDSAARDLTAFLDRASALKDDDVEGRLSLARWARDRQMWSQAAEMADQVLYRDPGNRAAYLILQQVDDARPLPAEPQTGDLLKAEFTKRFSHEFKTRDSKHFLICYDTPDAFTVQRAAAMEKVYDAFQFYFNMNTLRPDFLEHRLPVILLKSRDDYLVYGQQTEHTDLAWSAGFYSQRTNRSIFYDDFTGPSMATINQQAATLKTRIDDLNHEITTATELNQLGVVTTLTVERNRAGEALAQVNTRAGNTAQLMNNVKTMHEAAHQIAFNMGIQTRFVDYPLWFSEGLACSFEVEDSLGHRGPALLNFGRIAFLKEAIKEDKLISIDKFIATDTTDRTDEKALNLLYAQGWGLFHYLYKFQRAGMETYLLSYKTHAQLRPIGADERKVLFTKAFGGDLEDLNKKFVAYLKSLPAKAN